MTGAAAGVGVDAGADADGTAETVLLVGEEWQRWPTGSSDRKWSMPLQTQVLALAVR